MAEKEDPDAIEVCKEAEEMPVATTNWWAPWLDAAKSKSSEVFEFVKKDITEFTSVVKSEASDVYEFVKKDMTEITSVVKSEASAVVNSTAGVLKSTLKLEEPESTASTMKRSVSNFLGTVTSALSPVADDEGEEALLIQNDKPVPLSRLQTKLYALIKNPETFTNGIEKELKPQFESWLTIGDDLMTTEKLTKMLVASPDLHQQYETLVPEKVSHLDFWQRYLFRCALLEDEESMLEAKEKREQANAEKLEWDKGIDLTEEEQMKILADYENEKKGKSDEFIMKEKQGMVVVGDASCASTSSADTESKDTDDWEKVSDIEDNDLSK